MGNAHRCSCWPRPDDAGPCTPQTCDPRCRACRIHGRPFYSHGDLLYLEHGTGPLAAELDRLWRVRGQAGAAPSETRRAMTWTAGGRCRGAPLGWRHAAATRTVTEFYYPGLQDPPPGHHGRHAGSGQ